MAEAHTETGPVIDAGVAGNADNVKVRAVLFPQALWAVTESVAVVKVVVGILTVTDVPALAVIVQPVGAIQV